MSKRDIKQKCVLEEITEIKLDSYLSPSHSIKVNEKTFALITNHYIVESTETQIIFIKFYSIINNNIVFVGQYNFDNKIIKEFSDFVEMKVEIDNLIIITKDYLIVEKIIINIEGQYSFKNIILKGLSEAPFKILNNGRFVSFHNNNIKIYHYSANTRDIECLFNTNYDKALERLSNEWEKKNESLIEETNSEENELENSLADIIEIKEKNLIIISFSNCKYYYDIDIDYTKKKYLISIIDTKNYQIISNLINLIEAENLFYFGNEELFSFGLRKFFKLDLKVFQKKLILNENYIQSNYQYYHYNVIPFLNENILISFGCFRFGHFHNIDEYKHCCIFDIKNNRLNELDISNIHYNKYDVFYFPFKLNDNRILFVFGHSVKLFKFNVNELNLNNNQNQEYKRNIPRLYGIFDMLKSIFNHNCKTMSKSKSRSKSRSRSRSRSKSKKKSKNKNIIFPK